MQIGNAPNTRRLVLVAAAALVDDRGFVLIAQRPAHKQLGGLWEFPGGKIEPGESPEAALVRELQEELEIVAVRENLEPFDFASHAYEDFDLLMPLYLLRSWQGEPRAVEAQALAWVRPEELSTYAMPPADIALVERMQARLGARP